MGGALHWIPKLSAVVKNSLARPENCLVIFPTSCSPSEDSTCTCYMQALKIKQSCMQTFFKLRQEKKHRKKLAIMHSKLVTPTLEQERMYHLACVTDINLLPVTQNDFTLLLKYTTLLNLAKRGGRESVIQPLKIGQDKQETEQRIVRASAP